jgi:hypothetical protein
MERILRYINSFHLCGTHSIKKVGRLRLVCLKPETLDQLGTALALSSFKYTPSTHNNTLRVLQRTTLDPALPLRVWSEPDAQFNMRNGRK